MELGMGVPGVVGGRMRLSASVSTTRLATALGSHALVEDRVQLGASLRAGRIGPVSPRVGVSAGYTRFDRDDDVVFGALANGAPILSLLLGVEAALTRTVRLTASAGYSHLQASTVYPLVTKVGLHYRLRGEAVR
jgi:hypothetical protein